MSVSGHIDFSVMCFAIAHTNLPKCREVQLEMSLTVFGSLKIRILADESNDAKTCLDPSPIQRLMKSLFQD